MTRKPRPKTIKAGKVSIRLPPDTHIERVENLDEIFKPQRDTGYQERRSDVLIVVTYKGTRYAIIVEDTGVPEQKDFERLASMTKELANRGIIPRRAIVIKLLHHTGIRYGKRLLTSMARSYRVELKECRKTPVDLTALLARLAT